MADKTSDPAAMWRDMIGEMEKGFNSFANQAMASPEFSRAMNQAGNASAGVQKQFGDLMERYLTGMNLPSRAQMVSFGERLQAIEAQLNEVSSILRDMKRASGSADSSTDANKPRRTRQPPAEGGGQ